MFAEVLHSAMGCLPVTPHENTEFLVNPGPTRIQIGHMTQYDIVKYSIVHVDIAQFHAWVYNTIQYRWVYRWDIFVGIAVNSHSLDIFLVDV